MNRFVIITETFNGHLISLRETNVNSFVVAKEIVKGLLKSDSIYSVTLQGPENYNEVWING